MARSVDTPWKPATTATLPPSSASRRRSLRISRILALRCAVSVTMPACEPVNETAASPRSTMAMQSSAIEMRSPEVRSMSISRAVGLARDLVGEALEVVGGLAHGRDHDHDVVARAPGAHDVLRDGADAFGVGDGGAAELLHEQAHDRPWYRGQARDPLAYSVRAFWRCAVGRLPRRAQGHQTRTSAPEPGCPSGRRCRRRRSATSATAPSATSSLLLIPLAIVFVILQLTKSDDSSDKKSASTVDLRDQGAAASRRPRRWRLRRP